MRRKISLLLAVIMFAVMLPACGQERGDAAGESADGENGDFYTASALENWSVYDGEACFPVEAENVSLNGQAAGAYPVTAENSDTVELRITAPESAEYCIVADYRPVGDVLNTDALYEISCGGEEARTVQLPILWHDSVRGATDRSGNESIRKQESLAETVRNAFLDYSDISRNEARWTLNAGETYTFAITVGEQGLEFAGFLLYPLAAAGDEAGGGAAAEDDAGAGGADDVPTIPIEAESYALKSDSYIRASAVRDASLTPYDTYQKRINLIDSSAWSTAGQKVIWEFEVEQEGDYRLALHVKQNADVNKTVFRTVEIDGKVPTEEWEAVKIPYTGASGYHNQTLQGENGDLTVHLTEGTHTIAMTVTVGEYEEIYYEVQALMNEVNALGTALLKMTGGVIDENRTWDMEAYMPDAAGKLADFASRAEELYGRLAKIDGKDPVYAMDLETAADKLRDLLKEPEKIPGRTEDIFRGDDSASKYLGNVLSALTGQGLSLDKIYLYGQEKLPREDVSILTSAWESLKRFVWSFSGDAKSANYSVNGQEEEELEVWVGQSTVAVEILQQILDETYNKEQGTNIQLKVMPNEQKLVLANATGSNPDVVLCATAGMPFTFACRGALKDLSEYEDFMDFYTSQYQLESLVATSYGDGVYGAVDSRNFKLLFYRKDILASLNLQVPDTWEDVQDMMPTLLRNQMNFYIPLSASASLKGLGATTPYIYQMGGEIYTSDGSAAAINSEESVAAITEMTDFYRIYGMQTTVENFYLSFRYGEIPIGIGDFNTYLQLKMAAPELAGQWDVALCPGTRQEDGSVLRYQPANNTASMIFANTDKEEEAWEFLKWWLSEDTQYEYSLRRSQALGLEYQWITANLEAFRKLPLDSNIKEAALAQWLEQREVTPHPASYIVEREISGVWNDVVIDNSELMKSLDSAVLTIDREIRRKLQEFGYIEEDGTLIKDYNINILEMLYEKAGE